MPISSAVLRLEEFECWKDILGMTSFPFATQKFTKLLNLFYNLRQWTVTT